jgi:large subunit ribosomal protein L9
MKVLFLKTVSPHKAGQVATVADGYAKNFLIPKKLAVPASAHAVAEALQRKQKQVAHDASAEQNADALAKVLSGASVHVEAKAAASGTLYAAVTPFRITEAITEKTGYVLPEALQKQLPTLKRAGEHAVTLQIHATTITFTLDV